MLHQEAARRNLIWFAQYIDPKFQATPFHSAYYKILDKFAKGNIRKLIVQAPPQSGKSQGSSRFLPSDMLGINPDLKIGILSYASNIATDFNRDCQRIIDTPEYRAVFPDTTLNGSNVVTIADSYLRNSSVFEIVGHRGGLRAVGRGGALTSKTLDVAIMDDLFKDSQEGNSPVIRESAWNWYTKVVRTRLHNDSQELIVFTRWHEDDIIGRVLAREKHIFATEWADLENVPADTWVVVNFEAIKTGAPTEIDPREPGQALWPERHSLEKLKAARAIDPVGFECLYQGNPGSAEGRLYQPFKTWIEKGDYGHYVRSGCYVDVADEGDDNLAAATYDIYISDNTAWNEHRKRFEPIIYALITGLEYTDASTEVTAVTVPRLMNENGTQKAWIESNNGGSQFGKVVKTKVRALTIPFYQGANKEARIISNGAFVNQSIVFPFGWETRWPKAYADLMGFLRNFSANAHDDLCFVARTRIATPFGDKNIEDLRKGDYVITPLGYRRVLASGYTGEKEVIKRCGLEGTPNHPVFQGKRFDNLCGIYENLVNLHSYQNLKLWKYRQALHSMASNTALWGRESIIYLHQLPIEGGKIRKDFMLRFGNFIAERKFREAFVFIIKTATLLITSLAIWSAYRFGNICKSIWRKICKIRNMSPRISGLWKKQESRQKIGIEAKKDANGIGNTQNLLILQPATSKPAYNAEENSYHINRAQNFAATDAAKSIEHETFDLSGYAKNVEKNSDTGKENLHRRIGNSAASLAELDTQTKTEKRAVYNLTIEGAHCYYANGILVSNCDMLTGIYEKEIADGNTRPYEAAHRGVMVR